CHGVWVLRVLWICLSGGLITVAALELLKQSPGVRILCKQLGRRHTKNIEALHPGLRDCIVDRRWVQLPVDVFLQAHRPYLLDIAGTSAKAEPVEDVYYLL